jgi:hypothetical protein
MATSAGEFIYRYMTIGDFSSTRALRGHRITCQASTADDRMQETSPYFQSF